MPTSGTTHLRDGLIATGLWPFRHAPFADEVLTSWMTRLAHGHSGLTCLKWRRAILFGTAPGTGHWQAALGPDDLGTLIRRVGDRGEAA